MRYTVLGIALLTLITALRLGAQEQVSVPGSGDMKLRFDGRITFDVAGYVPASSLEGVQWDGEPFRLSSGANLSQLRLGMVVSLGDRWTGRFDANYANRRVNPTDVILIYKLNPRHRIIFGHYKDPVSMDNNTSSRMLSLQTPMAVQMLSRGERYIGVTYVGYGRHHWLSGGIYAGTIAKASEPNRGDDGYGIAGRAAWIPVNNDYTTIHLGASARWRRPEAPKAHAGGLYTMTLSTLPESTLDARRYVGATLTDVRSYAVGGLEAAVRFDKLYITGEYLVNHLYRAQHTDRVSGWTLTGAYMLLGRQRSYVASDAIFNPMESVGRGGSLELIGRVGQVSLNDLGGGVHGGSATSVLAGVNWYPHANVLLAMNYTYVNHDRHATAMGMITQMPEAGIDLHTLQLRAQFVF